MTKQITFENFTEHCFSSRLIDRLTAENQRLKAQLDKEIHINRKMKSALEKYANFQASGFASVNEESLLEMIKFAQEVLKEVGEEE